MTAITLCVKPDSYYDTFVTQTLNDPGVLPDAYSVALDGGEYVGQSKLAINERLGFVRQPAWIGLVKDFGGEGDR